MAYTDLYGNVLTHEELSRLLRQNCSVQYKWWHAKAQPRVDPDTPGAGRPPRGVRTNLDIALMRGRK